eukprot:TRINITY_DN11379_c1_g1_i2.p1 TRINITY_DN11379_c1_g1~~TRINITY_DN11379_c1_g1_i2.p1  ORF type:complete len:334 (+),score=42.96 TRINITY_DN11379_c1_g1_i2:859-1860(+)
MFTTPEQVFSVNHRPRIEKQVLKWINLFVFTGAFLCFAVTVTQVHESAARTLDGDFWLPGDFVLDSKLSSELGETCTHEATLRISSFDVGVKLNGGSRLALMAYTTALVRRSMWVNGGAVFVSLGNKVLFDRNVHELSWGLIVIPKGFLMLVEFVLIIWAIVALEQPQAGSEILEDYINYCSPTSSKRHLWAQQFVAMYIAWGVVLMVHIITFYLYMQRTLGYYYQPFPRVRREWTSLYSIVALRKSAHGSQESKVEIVAEQMLQEIKDSLYYQGEDIPLETEGGHEMHNLGAMQNAQAVGSSSAPSVIYNQNTSNVSTSLPYQPRKSDVTFG